MTPAVRRSPTSGRTLASMAARVGGNAGGRAGERRGAGTAARGDAQLRGTRGRRVSLGRRSAKAASARRRIVRRSSRSAPSWVGQARRQTRQRPTGRRGAITGQEVTRVGRRKQHRLLPSGASRVTVPPIPAAQPSSTWRYGRSPRAAPARRASADAVAACAQASPAGGRAPGPRAGSWSARHGAGARARARAVSAWSRS